MSFRDRMSAQNPIQVLSIGCTLGLITASSTTGGKYNFPLLLFGLVGHEVSSSNILLHQFLQLLMGSIFLDLYHILFKLSGLSLLFTVILLALKAPIGLTCMETLKQRGVTLQMPTMPTMANFQGGGMGGGYQRAEQGEANWSMPGGLGSGGGGASVPAATAPAQFPSSGGFRLGGEDDSPQSGGGGVGGGQPQTGRGGYQTID